MLDRAGANPAGPRDWRALHEERGTGRAVRVALHHHRAVADVRQQHRRDVGVVLNEHPFRDAALGPEGLLQVRQADFFPVDEKLRVAGGRHFDARRFLHHEGRETDSTTKLTKNTRSRLYSWV